jgi:hypothetical protein
VWPESLRKTALADLWDKSIKLNLAEERKTVEEAAVS